MGLSSGGGLRVDLGFVGLGEYFFWRRKTCLAKAKQICLGFEQKISIEKGQTNN